MRHRVIQWATGAMGKTALRAILDHPDMDLVGLYTYSDAKVGRDAGDIAHRPATGVFATNDVEAILALGADVAIHAGLLQPPYGSHDRDIVRLLESGKNVISINGYSYPRYWADERVTALEAACAKGGVSLMGAGLNPGYIGEKIAVTATSACSQVDHIEINEIVDCRLMRNPEYVFRILGFGSELDRIDPNDPAWGPASALNGMYSEVVATICHRMGWTLERIETDHEMAPAADDIAVTAGSIAKGTVSSTTWRWHGVVAGQRAVSLNICWTMESFPADTPLWKVVIRGLPDVRLALHLDRPQDHGFKTHADQLALGGAIVNAIPVVCAAETGLVVSPLSTPFHGAPPTGLRLNSG